MNIKKILIWILIIFLTLGALFVTLKVLVYKGVIQEAEFWSMFQKWGLIGLIAVIAVIGLIYLIKWLVNKEEKDESILPKEPIDADLALDKFLHSPNGFIVKTKIPCYAISTDDKENPIKMIPFDKNDIKIIDTQDFDSENLTGNNYWLIEVYAERGDCAGLSSCKISLDKGYKYVGNNILRSIKHHTSIEMAKEIMKQDSKHLPIDSPQDKNDRLELYKIKKDEEEGLSEEEEKQIDRLKQDTKAPLKPESEDKSPELDEEKKLKAEEIKLNNASKLQALLERQRGRN